MKTSTILALFVAILILGGGTWWYMTQNAAMPQNNTATPNNADTTTNINIDATTNNPATTTNNSTTTVNSGVTAAKTVTVAYSSSGFSPKTITINRGDTVRFVAEDGASMWVGVDDHPTHAGYDGTSRTEHCAAGSIASFDQCQTGSTYSFTFTKTGTFGYHNHVAANHTGTIIVR
jgi:plastocyanin